MIYFNMRKQKRNERTVLWQQIYDTAQILYENSGILHRSTIPIGYTYIYVFYYVFSGYIINTWV